jgi:hypothetical protein
MPKTGYMLVYEGLNGFRMMLPYVIAAERAQASTMPPQRGGPSKDRVSVITLDDEQMTAWRNPKTGIVDEERVSPGIISMRLVRYTP